jgi:hypothetical protein
VNTKTVIEADRHACSILENYEGRVKIVMLNIKLNEFYKIISFQKAV